MALKSRSLPLAILTIMVALVSFQASAIVGDYKPIKNLTDPWVVEIARFAVAVQNHSSNSTYTLEFVSIVKGEIQVVAGYSYRLVISAKDKSGKPNNYEAIVYYKPWEKLLRLISFRGLLGN